MLERTCESIFITLEFLEYVRLLSIPISLFPSGLFRRNAIGMTPTSIIDQCDSPP